ncbi:hypothetical protein MP638_000773 [Amoeboaphelidium occidentale]|nr:hypothetical protein MP638_000773 [Amoeboaphelidium occidentale]
MASFATRLSSSLRSSALTASAVFRQVYQKEKLSPPSMAEYGKAKQELLSGLSTIASKPVSQYTLAHVGRFSLLLAEVYGFFVVGEVVGRGQLVGYQY